MGTLVREWVVQKLGLPVPQFSDPVELRRRLSNGYVFAEILRKYSIISDDQLIALGHNFTEQTKLKNMKYVHRWMTGAGILFNFSDFLDVAEEKPGAVVNFLYKLYFALEGTHRARGEKNLDSEGSSIYTTTVSAATSVHKDFLPDQQFDYDIGSESFGDTRSRLEATAEERAQRLMVMQSSEETVVGDLESESDSGPPFSSIPHCISDTTTTTHWNSEDLDELAEKRVQECPVPQILLPSKGDTREATRLYFALQAAAKVKYDLQKEDVIKKKWNAEKRRNRWESQGSNSADYNVLRTIDFSGSGDQKRLEQMRAKVESEYKLAKEMEDFDTAVYGDDDIPSSDGSGEGVKIPPGEIEPVCSNPVEWQIRVHRLKRERKEEQENSDYRIRLRKTLSEKFIKNIPQQIHDDLVHTTLAKTLTIFGKEVEMSDFLLNTHNRSKGIFLDHLRLEEDLMQEILINRSDQMASQKLKEETVEQMLKDLGEKRSQRIEGERAEKEMALLLKIIHHQLNMMVRLVCRIGDYRAIAGGTDPSEEQIAEWKAWLLLGLETPPELDLEDSGDKLMEEFDLADGKCHIMLSETPIPIELQPPQLPAPNPHIPKDIRNLFATNAAINPVETQKDIKKQ